MAADDQQLKLVVAAVDNASQTIKGVQGQVSDFSKSAKRDTDDVANNTDRNSDIARKAFTGIGIALGATGVAMTVFAKNSVDSTVAYAGEVKKLSREIGASTEQTSELIYAGKRMGLTADQASVSFGMLAKKIVEARDNSADAALKTADLNNKIADTKEKITATTAEIQKNGDKTGELSTKVEGLKITLQKYNDALKATADPLTKLGVNTKTASGEAKPFNDILLEVADKFKAMPNGAEKTADAMALFGRSGKDLLPLLNQGSGGIKELEAQADKLGLTLTAKTMDSVHKYTVAQKDMNDQVQALKLRIGIETMPVLTAFQGKMNELVAALLSAPGPIKSITTDFLAFGGPVMSGAGALVGFGANLATIVPALKDTALGIGAISLELAPWVLAIAGATVVLVGLTYGVRELHDRGVDTDSMFKQLQTTLELNTGALGPMFASMHQLVNEIAGGAIHAWELKNAQDAVKASQDQLKSSTDALKDSHLSAATASLGVEQAQKSYNDAVKQYGPTSLEARVAANYLEVAKNNLAKADADVKKKQDDATAAQVAAKDAHDKLKAKSDELKGSVDRQSGSWGGLAGSIQSAWKSFSNFATPVANSILHGLHIPGFASGVENFSGGLAVVGERGPELVNLPAGSTVYSNAQSKQMASGGGGVTINNTFNVTSPVDLEHATQMQAWQLRNA